MNTSTLRLPDLSTLSPENRDLLHLAASIAHEAGYIHTSYFDKAHQVGRKELNDIVTEVDLLAEKHIINRLRTAYPSHGINSEEAGSSGDPSIWNWVIDPLDGTINYSTHLPFYAVSLAAQYEGKTKVAVVYAPATDSLYVAAEGFGAYHNGIRLACSSRSSLADSVLSFMLTSHYSDEYRARALSMIAGLTPALRGLRIFVGQAIELALIADGVLDGHVCIKSRGFSAAAGVLLITEAGGQVTDLAGITFSNTARSLVASNGHLHSAILNSISMNDL